MRTFQNFCTENVDQEKILNICKSYTENLESVCENGTSLIFAGNSGTGKTHLACAIINFFIDNAKSACYTTVLRMIRRLKASWDRGSSTEVEGDVLKALLEPVLLVIDEVGVQYGSEAEKILFFEVINQRYENIKPTILISNENEQNLRRYIGDRVFDRMLEGGGMVLTFNWGSMRSKI